MDSVWALYALQKSMMLTPCGPSAVPTGGAGVAAPACSCTLTSAAIFFLGGIAGCVLRVVRRGHREPDRLCHLGCRWGVAGVSLGCPRATWSFWSLPGQNGNRPSVEPVGAMGPARSGTGGLRL